MRRLLAAVATAVAVLATACGTTQPPSTGANPAPSQITLTDASGASLHLDRPATKVVGTEWNVVDDLITLGVAPVGVADVKGYKAWASAVPLKNAPKDIGMRDQPSMDTIASLAPDLIIATTDLPSSAVKQMRKVAPVLLLESAKASDQIGLMTKSLDLIAQATGRTKQAQAAENAFEAKVAAGKKAIEGAGRTGAKVAFADGYVASNQVTIRPYTKGSLIGAVNERLGLQNAWTVKGDKKYGLGATDVEGLTTLGDVQFAYIANDGDGGDPFARDLAKNSVWKGLPFVKAGHVHRLPEGIWMFGGPASMEAYIDGIVGALTK
ncbi:ABC transporter substrate-binding protein [Actinoallomurus acaciae]|uniref:ABC transporter substrate-binding protein n=1 Tax=Actinoallomurus acaciae TaxID=502577 RepID=A0ABV5YNE5_9ACTN